MKKIFAFFFCLCCVSFVLSIEFDLGSFYKDNYAIIISNENILSETSKKIETELRKQNFEVQTLIEEKTEKILGTLEDLALIFSNKESRVLIIFLGESEKEKNQFFYPTKDGKISSLTLQKYIYNIKAKNMLLIFDFPFTNYYSAKTNLENLDFSYSKIGLFNVEQICSKNSSFIDDFILCLQGFGDLNKDNIISAKEIFFYINSKNEISFSENNSKSTFLLKRLVDPFDEKIIPQITSAQIDLFFKAVEKNKLAWFEYQGILKLTYQKIADYQLSKNTDESKILLWQYFINLFSTDNPYSREDNFYLQTAKSNIDSLKIKNNIDTIEFNPPKNVNFDMSDIPMETLKELKLKWDKTQKNMEDFYRQTLSFVDQINLPSYNKKAWENFLLAFPKNNPFTNVDDTLRKIAENNIVQLGNISDINKINLDLPLENTKSVAAINEKYDYVKKNKELWDANLIKMKEAFTKMLFLSEKNEASSELWQNFLKSYNKENPYSKEDKEMVEQANLHIKYEKYRASNNYKPIYFSASDSNVINNFVVIKNNNIYNFNAEMKNYINYISKIIGEKNNMLLLQIDQGKNLWFKENLEVIDK